MVNEWVSELGPVGREVCGGVLLREWDSNRSGRFARYIGGKYVVNGG